MSATTIEAVNSCREARVALATPATLRAFGRVARRQGKFSSPRATRAVRHVTAPPIETLAHRGNKVLLLNHRNGLVVRGRHTQSVRSPSPENIGLYRLVNAVEGRARNAVMFAISRCAAHSVALRKRRFAKWRSGCVQHPGAAPAVSLLNRQSCDLATHCLHVTCIKGAARRTVHPPRPCVTGGVGEGVLRRAGISLLEGADALHGLFARSRPP